MACILIIAVLFCAISKENVIFARTFTEDTAIEYMENMEKQISILTSTINKLQANQDQQIASQEREFAMMNTRLAQQDCTHDKKRMELAEYMANTEKQILVLTARINKNQDEMVNQKINIAQQNAKFAEQNAKLNTEVAQQNTKIAKQDTKFALINKRFAELDCSHDKKKVEQKKKDPCNCSAEQKLELVEQASQIAEQNKSLADQKTVILKLNTTLEKQAARIGDQNISLAEQKTVISKLNTTLAKQAARIGDQNKKIAEYNATFEEQAAQIGNQNTIIGHLNSSLDNQTTRLTEQAAQIADQNVIIEQLNNSLAEEIAKHKKGPCLGNIALNKPAAQSSTTLHYTADKAVDGNNITNSETTYRSTRSTTQWWCVDLLQQYSMSTINIIKDWYGYGFKVRLSSTGSCNQSGFNSATLCYTEPEVNKRLYSVTGCNDGRQMSGRYVFIGEQSYIELNEVEIYSN